MKRRRNPRYLKQYRDHAGNWINQYRRNGRVIRLPNGLDFSEVWWKAYYEAEAAILAGEEVREIGESRTKPGSVSAALVAYYRSTSFCGLAANTKRTFRTSLERDFRVVYGDARIAHLRHKHVRDIIDEKTQKAPAGARTTLTALRSFMRFCVATEIVESDPTIGVRRPKLRSEGIHTWTETEIGQFEAYWPIDSVARLAMGLHLYTAQRASDVILMGWQNVGRDGVIRIKQQKTGAAVAVPIHPELERLLHAVPRTNLTFLLNGQGRPFVHGYMTRFREWCDAAGLPKRCSSHGLRKAAMNRLAEAGCNPLQIAAISGHRSLSEVQHYTEKVDRERLARQAMAAITQVKTGTGSV